MQTNFVLNAMEQALYSGDSSVWGPDMPQRQKVAVRQDALTERLAEAGVEPSAGSRVDIHCNALMVTIRRLYKVELIHCPAS